MRRIRLLGIAPYEGLYHLMANLAAQRDDVKLTVRMGNLQEALASVRQGETGHVDAIISRGGTGELLRENVDVPVYDVTPSVYDILRTIRLAQEMGEPFAIVGFPTITERARTLCEIMNYRCEVRTIHSEADCGAVLAELRDKGIGLIVGDTISVQSCREFDMHGLLIVSGLESVEDAIDSAVEMFRHFDALAQRAALLSDVLATGLNRVLIFSSDGKEVYRSSEEIPEELTLRLHGEIAHVIVQKSVKLSVRVGQVFYSILGRRIVSTEEEYCAFSVTPRQTDAVAMDKYHIRILTAETDLPGSYPMEFYIGSGSYGEELRSLCERCASVDTPVLLLGPRGTGKGRIAHYIYSRSQYRHSSLVWIDIAELTEKGWDYLMDSEYSPLLDSGLTIFFRNINRLDSGRAKVLLTYLRSSGAAKANRLMFSYDSDDPASGGDDLYFFLTEELRCARLHTAALSERVKDIQPLVGLCINTFNVQYGTQLIGLSRDAMLAVQNHHWPHNVDQMVQFISRLVAGSNSAYVSEENVRRQLAGEKRPAAPGREGTAGLDLTRPLSEIERDIVRAVYREEGMNQTRTAERLGISRSTVWRILKD